MKRMKIQVIQTFQVHLQKGKYSINNSGAYRKCTVPYEAIKLYSLNHPSLPASTIIKYGQH